MGKGGADLAHQREAVRRRPSSKRSVLGNLGGAVPAPRFQPHGVGRISLLVADASKIDLDFKRPWGVCNRLTSIPPPAPLGEIRISTQERTRKREKGSRLGVESDDRIWRKRTNRTA
jgi:hypothetical protein